MAVKIYNVGGAIIIEGLFSDIQCINASAFDWIKDNDIYKVRDGIQKQDYELGELSNIQNKLGVTYTTDLQLQADLNGLINIVNSVSTESEVLKPLNFDAWGRNKVVLDRSIVHGMFTFNVPVDMWNEVFNGTEQAITVATSVDGALSMKSGATLNDVNYLHTFRYPRYEPNRGHLYSTACILPSKTDEGIREFGLFTPEAGCFFRLKSDGELYAVIRTTINNVTTDNEQLIDTTGIDVEKGNIYDIQFQWRGVGNYKFMINLVEVYCFEFLGTLTNLSIFNPALPIAFRCENLNDNVEIICGCVDVSSEGGSTNGKVYGSISMNNQSGQVAISGYNVPVIAVRSKKTVNGKINTRDTLALLLSAYSSEKGFIRVWKTRDFTAITKNDQDWADYGDGHLEYIVYDLPDITTPMTFNTAKADLVFGCRVNQDESYSTSALFEGRTNIWLSPGDMFVFTMHRENGGLADVGATFEYAEEI